MSDSENGASSKTNLLLTVVVFIVAFVVLKYVIGIAFAILKWVLIAGVALVATQVVVKRLGGPKDGG